MSRLAVVLRTELKLQWRYRFLQAGVFSGLMWLALLLPMPLELRSLAEPYVILGDVAIIGWFFIAGAVFLERGDRVLSALVATPLRFGEYLIAKLATLTGLSVLIAVVVATATHGTGYHLGWLVLGAALGTVPMLLVSFMSALPFASISSWFMPSVVPLAVMNAPIFSYSGVWESPGFYLVPTQGPLLFLGAAFDQQVLAGWQIGYGIVYPVLFVCLMYVPARRMFDTFVVAKSGGQ